jgi:hypothetical protein
MIDKYYKILGAVDTDSDEIIKEKYLALRSRYEEERFLEGEAGNAAAKKLTEIENAYEAIVSLRNESIKFNGKSNAFESVEAAIKSGNLQAAQSLLDDITERSAEWHYFQSVVFYKKNWINESKKHLEIAKEMNPSEPKYQEALYKIEERVKAGSNVNAEWSKANGNNHQNQGAEQQLGGDSCMQWCCDIIICNTLLNCCCSCR